MATKHKRRPARSKSCILSLLLALVLGACESAGYYKQAVVGQMALLNRRRPIDDALEDEQTPAAVRHKLDLVLQVRQFAEKRLLLPVGEHYLAYADLNRAYAVWVVYAAPEFSLEPKTWHYPVIGRSHYRGYFSEKDAKRYAHRLAADGFDVYVTGVAAYSTLGWFEDAVLNTMIDRSDASLAALIFHELAHQLLYVADDSAFNESFATAVEQEGLRRWLEQTGHRETYQMYELGLERRRQFIDLVTVYRRRLDDLYKSDMKPNAKRSAKMALFDQMRSDYRSLKAEWGGYDGYDRWFSDSLNNAKLISVATYNDFVPAFKALLANCDGDLKAFYERCRQLAKQPKAERHRKLQELMERGEMAAGNRHKRYHEAEIPSTKWQITNHFQIWGTH